MGKVVIDGVEFLFNKLYQNDSETDEIVADMFSENKLITYVEMETVTIINYGAFYGCSNLTTAIFKNLRVLGNHVFAGCNFKTIEIPNVISIGNLCFATNQSLEKIVLNDEIAEIENSTFTQCRGLVNIHLPENLEKIGSRVFLMLEN
ncbi:leucine-rich repeat domain-containing protein [Fusobacterium ulcerans]|uniref:leucine-rich repeat domain-containing protein n=1 Tax=Fusobacterium ulcerans TaxID=861 RepID=UPI00241DFFAF|nr:leucine-rich repeat domain-containing protein [Fusobacterium ulcerans]